MTAYQYFDCLMTMFNILLIFAGILEYVLLGIDFKVSLHRSDRKEELAQMPAHTG